jgi:hypothetical protein
MVSIIWEIRNIGEHSEMAILNCNFYNKVIIVSWYYGKVAALHNVII